MSAELPPNISFQRTAILRLAAAELGSFGDFSRARVHWASRGEQ